MSRDLLLAWSEWTPTLAPYVLDQDRSVFDSVRSRGAVVTFTSWRDAYQHQAFGTPGDRKLHLGLLPQPFCGDVRNAAVYLLLLNPGLSPTDYYGEFCVPEFRNALCANLKQASLAGPPFIFLDPQYSWHAGYLWWERKFRQLIQQASRGWAITFAEARARLAARLASIELVPYHSGSFHDADRWVERLPSVKLAGAFVRNVVIPRVERGDALVIAARRAKVWELPPHPAVITYVKHEAQAALMTPKSRGGIAVLEMLKKLY